MANPESRVIQPRQFKVRNVTMTFFFQPRRRWQLGFMRLPDLVRGAAIYKIAIGPASSIFMVKS